MAAAPIPVMSRRFAFSCAYCWGWMRQQENLQLGIPRETARRFPRRLQELCGYSVYKGQFGHIDNRDPIELLGRERGKRMVWEATDIRKARMGERRSSRTMRHSGRCGHRFAEAKTRSEHEFELGSDAIRTEKALANPSKPQIRRLAAFALGFARRSASSCSRATAGASRRRAPRSRRNPASAHRCASVQAQ